MAGKDTIHKWSTTAGSNNDLSNTSIQEGVMDVRSTNDVIRNAMAQIKTFWNAGFGYYSTESGNFSVNATDDQSADTNDNWGFIDCTAALTATLPAATGVTANWGCLIHNSHASATVSIARSSTNTINGATSVDVPPGWSALVKRISTSAYKVAYLPALTSIGAATNLLQPAFSATNSAADLNQTGDDTAFTIICDTEQFDRNGDYNNATGVLTAPVTGLYHIGGIVNVSGITSGMTTLTLILVLTSGSITVISSHAFNVANASVTVALPWSIFVAMTAADTALHTIALSNGTLVADVNTLTRFWGYLVA